MVGRIHAPLRCAIVLALASVGCGGDPRQGDETGMTGIVSFTASGTTSESGDPDDDTGDKLDVAGGSATMGGGEAGEENCSKIDFLFVVDSSGSMADEQQALIASFPGFVDTIVAATGAMDFQILVIDTDAYVPPGGNTGQTCTPDPTCCDTYCATNMYSYCNAVQCNPPPPPANCDEMLGAGKVLDQLGNPCGIDSGQRYMLASQADLAGTFACVAEVGTNGSGNEQPMEGLAVALDTNMIQAGGCNEGFVRDDAVLVLVVITDEEDDHEDMAQACMIPFQGSAGEPPDWFQAVVDAKLGVEQNAVVLSLQGPVAPDPVCPALDKCGGGLTGAEPAPRVSEFTKMFSRNLVGQVCAANYDQFFADAVALVENACEEFVPPG